ncbi:MAG: MFS transporter [Hyphomicrobiales bacterium]|nr:MAG: MFS transporter [Hyphomicrobiales bacterium]
MTQPASRLKVLLSGIFSLMLTLGIARFAYTPLLPVMIREAGLGLGWGGGLATVNYAGYLCGALIAASISDPGLKDRLYRAGLLTAIVTTGAMGLTDNLILWSLLRFFSGLASAAGLLLGSGLVLNWLIRHGFKSELGIHFAGIGLGMVLCALAVELMAAHLSWDQQWLVFTLLGAVLAVPAWAWLPPPSSFTGAARANDLPDNPPERLFMILFMASYFFAGVGYVVSATFIVAIIDDLPGLAGQGTWTFMIIGLAAAPACIVWDLAARRLGHLGALRLAYALHIPAVLLPVLVPGLASAMVSAVLFGMTFLGIVSLVLTMAGLYYPSRPARMMGRMTISYGVAQILAPAIVGRLAGASGHYNAGLFLAAGAVAVGFVILLTMQRGAAGPVPHDLRGG